MRLVLMLLVLLAPAISLAESDDDRAAADALFKEGRRLAKDGKFAAACPKFEASLTLDDTAGTLLNLADCYDQIGRTASAWSRFVEASERLQRDHDDRYGYARDRATRLEPRLAWLTIKVADAARVPGLTITRNKSPIPEAVFDTRIPIDPAQYLIVVSAEGYTSWSRSVTLLPAGGDAMVEVPVLDKVPVVTPPPVPNEPAPPPQPTIAKPNEPAPAIPMIPPRPEVWATTPRQRVAIGIAVVGVAGIGVGIGFGLSARSGWNDAQAFCDASECSQHGLDLIDTAKSRADIATGSFIGGTALLVGGLVLYATAPKDAETEAKVTSTRVVPAVGSRRAGLLVTGSF